MSRSRLITLALLLAASCLTNAMFAPSAWARPSTRPSAYGAGPRLLADADIPGTLMPATVVSGSLSQWDKSDDVWRVWLYAGEQLSFKIVGSAGTRFVVDLYAPGSLGVQRSEPVAFMMGTGYPEILGYTVPVGASGWYYADVYALGGQGAYVLTSLLGDPPVTTPITRVSGADRYLTALAISRSTFETAAAVVVATGRDSADALAASALAGSWDSPILLVNPAAPVGATMDAVKGEIRRLGASTILVVGGAAAVPPAVSGQLAMAGSVTRIGGADRFETARLIAGAVAAHEASVGREPTATVFLANGFSFADPLSVAPYAFSQRVPVLLTRATALPASTASALREFGAANVIVAGSETVVGRSVYSAITLPKTRLQGADRYQTCVAVVGYAMEHGWADLGHVGFATGLDFPDALGGAPATGRSRGVLLLTPPLRLSPGASAMLSAHSSEVTRAALYGGPIAIAGSVMGDIDAILR